MRVYSVAQDSSTLATNRQRYKLLFIEMVRQAVSDLRREHALGPSCPKQKRLDAEQAAAFLRCRACEELLEEFDVGQAEMVSRLRKEGLRV
jgi:hypothetical protein